MRMESTITDRLIAHIAEICSVTPTALSRDTLIDDIGLDSLSLPRILHALETEFQIQLEEDDIVTILEARSIGIYIDVLNAAVAR
jgi:acyl carrier protein